jgi:transcriptional regulator with XRE-family HTH domain
MAIAKSEYGRGTGKPHPVDVHVGARVRLRRTLRGMTQTDLADAIGLTFQQVQKYERGVNRIGSSRLYKLSQVLDVPINYFFDDMPPAAKASSPGKGRGRAKGPVKIEPDPFARRETLSLVRAYDKIEDADIRQRVYELTKAVGAGADNPSKS